MSCIRGIISQIHRLWFAKFTRIAHQGDFDFILMFVRGPAAALCLWRPPMPDVLTLCGVPWNLGFTSLLFPRSLSLFSAGQRYRHAFGLAQPGRNFELPPLSLRSILQRWSEYREFSPSGLRAMRELHCAFPVPVSLTLLLQQASARGWLHSLEHIGDVISISG